MLPSVLGLSNPILSAGASGSARPRHLDLDQPQGRARSASDRGRIATRTVVNATDGWSTQLNEMAGVSAPNRPLRREVLVTAPLRRTIDACEVGRAALLLASDSTTAITGEVLYVDAGFHIEGMVFH